MLLGNILKSVVRKYRTINIEGISFDSRKIRKNYIFFAINGEKTSGSKFIKDAISKRAKVIVTNKKIKQKNLVPFILVKDVRKSLAEASSNFYKKKPSNIIAVTGTNGKSSVADFFYQILLLNKKSVASIGTLGVFSKKYKKKTNLTTMDPLTLHRNLEILKEKKIEYVILEASSHGLSQKRLDYLKIKTGIFTNFSHDHLDYHKNMKSYFNSKMYLFNNLLKKKSNIIADEETKKFKIIKNIARKRKLKKNTIGLKSGNILILERRYKQDKQIIKILDNYKTYLLEIPLIGYFQVKNLLMAILAASSCGIKRDKIFKQIKKIKPVSGRLECVSKLKNNSKIIVDFAHTPDALKQTLIALKQQYKREIIIVFGCGGERDKKKRYEMGMIARKYCRKIFVTDDNPRNENPEIIRNSIIKGCKKLAVSIGDRKKAIDAAVLELNQNEILLVAGKGHEKTQDYGNIVKVFSDKKVIKEIVKRRKKYFKKLNWSNFLTQKVFKRRNFKELNFNGVSINTKKIKKNNLFFAIKGKKRDGHNFVKEAINNGAVKAVVNKKIKHLPRNKTIIVKNTLSSLNDLARSARNNTEAQIIGITGSVGKTTVKNLISFALKNYGKVHFSPHSYNNKFGVPLTLCNLKPKTEYGVFEIGMDKKGEINDLSKIIQPKIALITNISEAHLKNFNSLTGIAKAKAEIIENVTIGGSIILNKDDKFFTFLLNKSKKRGLNIISFGLNKKADIFLLGIKKINNLYILKVRVKDRIFYFYTKQILNNFLSNIMACISVLYALNLNLNNMKKKFINFSLPSGRGDVKIINKFNKRFKFIDESYNANPLSMSSAINNVSSFKKNKNEKKLAFLSDMLELGKKSKKFHKDLSKVINKSDIDKVYVYGNHIKETFDLLSKNKKGKKFQNLDQAYNHLGKIIKNNDLLMVKGSNATGLNQFSKNIKRGYTGVI